MRKLFKSIYTFHFFNRFVDCVVNACIQHDYAQELLYMDQRIFATKLWEFIPHIGYKLAFITQHVTGVYIEMLVKERPVLLS